MSVIKLRSSYWHLQFLNDFSLLMVEAHLPGLEHILFVIEDSQTCQMSSENSFNQGYCSGRPLKWPLDLKHAPVSLDCNCCPQFILSVFLSLTTNIKDKSLIQRWSVGKANGILNQLKMKTETVIGLVCLILNVLPTWGADSTIQWHSCVSVASFSRNLPSFIWIAFFPISRLKFLFVCRKSFLFWVGVVWVEMKTALFDFWN